MIIVSDATPLNVLVRIELVELLPTLYGEVVIPPAVYAELSHLRTPLVVRQWIMSQHTWLQVRAPGKVEPIERKGRGEREAISLARELRADLLLVDDRNAARAARSFGILTIGTLGILELASARALCPLTESTKRLQATDFFIEVSLIERALDRDRERLRRQALRERTE